MKLFTICLLIIFSLQSRGQLKSVIYDFDGLTTGSNDLPDGDYRNNDLNYSVDGNPLAYSDVISDRVLKLDMNWQAGLGEFGKATMRFIELNTATDYLNFYFYNPTSSSGAVPVTIIITEDDNGNNIFDGASDDKWVRSVNIAQNAGWQLLSLPLSSFTDGNTEGNGAFDAAYTNAAGMVFSIGFTLSKPTPSSTTDQFYIDMICFSEGALPHGASILDLPPENPAAGAFLGALGGGSPDQVPNSIQSLLPSTKKLSFVNWFLYYANTGTTPNVLPGQEVQNLINNGYTPIITWEMMYAGYTRLDPVQPRLDKILDGSFDAYIDQFANKIKTYTGNIILRIFHEFEGDWYSWSLTQNNADATKYKNAFRHVVDRFRNLGVNNVQWMWCVNAEPKPYVAYNWIIGCYPGDNYVDIVATDIYNHPDLGTPAWKSFRYTMAESYYYLTKYIPNKPLYICEVASRERNTGESGGQSKGDWLCQMSRDLQTYFNKTKAVVFFSIVKEHDWRINSSTASQQSFIDCLWNDSFFSGPVDLKEFADADGLHPYPNPFIDQIRFVQYGIPDTTKNVQVKIIDVTGKTVWRTTLENVSEGINTNGLLPVGLYVVEVSTAKETKRSKLIKSSLK